jgi:5'-deoxynucleotidase YfbR-like HD superfamily hydrolase
MRAVPRELYASGKVRRWHTHPYLTQTNADHSWGVATILALIHPAPSAELLMEALLHDAHEGACGDVPSTAKDADFKRWEARQEQAFRERNFLPTCKLSDEDKRWLKLADMIEARMFLDLSIQQDMQAVQAAERLDRMIDEMRARLEPGAEQLEIPGV